MKTLEEQLKDHNIIAPVTVLNRILDALQIEERGGGPEGLYYTHAEIDGEFLFRNLPELVTQIYMGGNLTRIA